MCEIIIHTKIDCNFIKLPQKKGPKCDHHDEWCDEKVNNKQ